MKKSMHMQVLVGDDQHPEFPSRETFSWSNSLANDRVGNDPPKAPRKSGMLPTEWAKVGGKEYSPAPTNAFASKDFIDRYQPGEVREIYVGACEGQHRLAKLVQTPIYKVSTCSAGRLKERMFELQRDRYGACCFDQGCYLAEEGWDKWFPSHLRPMQAASPNSPVVAEARRIKVRLPQTLSANNFDIEFDALTRMGAVDLWAMSDEARKHCAFLGVDPSVLQRFTAYPGWRLSPVQEICGFSIYEGADRLISLAERIILHHLGLQP